MGKVVYAAAMSHVLFPDYYAKNVGPHGRVMVEELIAVVHDMGRDLLAARPDALVVVAIDLRFRGEQERAMNSGSRPSSSLLVVNYEIPAR